MQADLVVYANGADGRSLARVVHGGSISDELSIQSCERRVEVFNAILASRASRKCIALVHIGGPAATSIDQRGLRLIETIRRHPSLAAMCRPVAVVHAVSKTVEHASANAGAFGVVSEHQLQDPANFDALITSTLSRVPRKVGATRTPLFTLDLSGEQEEDLPDFDQSFKQIFGTESGPHDDAIIEAWAKEIPEKLIVESVENDANSGWSGSTVSRRIERIRELAPVLYRDNSGNLAKVRLAQDLLTIGPPRSNSVAGLTPLPDVDRCAELAANDDLMRETFLDDDARIALNAVVNRRVFELTRSGGRPRASARAEQLERDVTDAFENSFSGRYRSAAAFRSALARALYGIADTELERRASAA